MTPSLIQLTGKPPAIRLKVVQTLAKKRKYSRSYAQASRVRFVGPVFINADRSSEK